MQLNIAKGIIIVINFFLNGAAIFPTTFNLFLAFILSHQFNRFNKQFKQAISSHVDECVTLDEKRFEHFRLQHQTVCKMVKRADSFINLCNVASIVGQTGVCILVLYCLTMYYSAFAGDPISIFMLAFWLTWALVGLTMTATGGVLVNNAVSDNVWFSIED